MPTEPSSTVAPNADGGRAARVVRASFIVSGAFVLSKVVGLLRDRAIAHAFGASPELDAYVAAFRIPDLLFTLIAGGALISAFLPVFAEALARDDPDDAWTIASGVTNVVFATTALLAGIAAVAAPWLTAQVVAPGFGPDQQALTVDLMRIVLVSTLVFALSGIQMGILNAFQHFWLPALAPIVYNAGILAGAAWLAPRFGIRGLAYGVVLGAVGHLVVKLPGLARHGFRYRPAFALAHPAVRQVLRLMAPRIAALATVQAVFIVNTRLASALPGGSLAALNFAWVISQMPQTILGTAVGTAAFPTLAELAARGDRAGLRATMAGAVRAMVALSLPAAVAMIVLAEPIVAVLLQTGRFDVDAARATTLALQMFAGGLVGHVVLEIVARVFYARKDTLTPLYMAAAAMGLNVVLAYALVGPMAQGGLALANTIAVTLEVALGLWLLRQPLGGVDGRRIGGTAVRSAIAGAAMAVAMIATLAAVPPLASAGIGGGPLVEALVRAALASITGGLAYLTAAIPLGLVDPGAVWRRIRRT